MSPSIRDKLGSIQFKNALFVKFLEENLSLLFLGVYVVSQYLRVLNSRFWNLDDHTFALWKINANQNLLENFVANLFTTNFGEWGHGVRFTPTLDILMALRFAMFGTYEKFWFALNLAMVVATILGFFLWCKQLGHLFEVKRSFTSQITISIIGSILLINPYSAGVFTRLVVGETFATAILFFVLYFSLRIQCKDANRLTKSIFVLLLIILMGCKENYIFPSLALLFISLQSNTVKWSEKAKIAWPVLVASSLVAYGFFPGLIRNKVDIYGRSTEASSILEIFPNFFSFPLAQLSLALSILSIAILHIAGLSFRSNMVLILFPPLWMLSDFIFYRGIISGHYFQNFMIASLVSLSITSFLAIHAVRKSLAFKSIETELLMIILLAIFVVAIVPSQKRAINVIVNHVNATQSFQNGLKEVISAQRESQIVFIAQSAWDYETIISVGRYVLEKEPKATAFLYADKENLDAGQGWSTIRQWSIEGLDESIYLPLPPVFKDRKYSCIFSQSMQVKLPNFCNSSIIIRWVP
jgi:hypothetical protein